MRYDLLLLDLDGTLLDYNQGERHALRQVFGELGLSFDELRHPQVYRRINDELWNRYEAGEIERDELRHTRFRRFFAEINDPGSAPDPDDFSRRYLEALSSSVFLEDGARELLDLLYGQLTLAVVSNGFASVQYPRLEIAGIRNYFDVVIVSDEVRSRKPEPAVFEAALEGVGKRSGTRPPVSRCLILGDGIYSDMAGAFAFGMDSCWYNPEALSFPLTQRPTFEVSRLSEVPACLL